MKKSTARVDEWGILSKFKDAFGNWRGVTPQSRRIIHKAMGENPRASLPSAAFRILRPGTSLQLDQPAELRLEDGTLLHLQKQTPAHLPCGYHELTGEDGNRMRVLMAPEACYLPPRLRMWGWAVQLYALRSEASWGMGDLGDLREFGRWSARELGCGFCLINPLGAAIPIVPQQSSPYYPSSRAFYNPLYLRVEDVPGARASGRALGELAAASHALNQPRLIDRDGIFHLKLKALELLWKRFEPTPAFEKFCRAGGDSLKSFAAYCVLARLFRKGWQKWPARFHSPHSPAVRHYVEGHPGDVRFHQWLQWLLQGQMRRAAAEIPIIQDLPIGVDPAGADAWIWQDLLAQGVHVGAPPDALNAQGQNWGMQPFNPHRLREAFFEPFRLTIRAILQFGGGLRIDHVMGLFRLFWIPAGKSGQAGAYVHYPVEELLAILAIESHRAKAVVIGEDLGTVEAAMRRELRRRNVLSYRLLWFENGPVRRYPKHALAAISTHDLYTLAGLWGGSDFVEQEKMGMRPDPAGRRRLIRKLCRQTGLTEAAGIEDVILRTHRLLAQSPSMLLAASLDDALAVPERPNMPGTLSRPNWSLALPQSLREIKRNPRIREIAASLRKGRQKKLRPRR